MGDDGNRARPQEYEHLLLRPALRPLSPSCHSVALLTSPLFLFANLLFTFVNLVLVMSFFVVFVFLVLFCFALFFASVIIFAFAVAFFLHLFYRVAALN